MLVLVHTVAPLIAVFDALATEQLPTLARKHVLDEPLLEAVRQRGGLAPEDADRLLAHVVQAEKIGAQAVLVTCSTTSPLVDSVRPRVKLPVVKVDEAMITQAVALGIRLGVVATNPTTLEPTRQLLAEEAGRLGRVAHVEMVLVPGALDDLLRGRGENHDVAVRRAVLDLSGRVEVVILAQASMARVLGTIPEVDRPVPVLASPLLALARVAELLGLPAIRPAGPRP